MSKYGSVVTNLLCIANGVTFKGNKIIVTNTNNTFTLSDFPNESDVHAGECRGFKLDCNTIITKM